MVNLDIADLNGYTGQKVIVEKVSSLFDPRFVDDRVYEAISLLSVINFVL